MGTVSTMGDSVLTRLLLFYRQLARVVFTSSDHLMKQTERTLFHQLEAVFDRVLHDRPHLAELVTVDDVGQCADSSSPPVGRRTATNSKRSKSCSVALLTAQLQSLVELIDGDTKKSTEASKEVNKPLVKKDSVFALQKARFLARKDKRSPVTRASSQTQSRTQSRSQSRTQVGKAPKKEEYSEDEDVEDESEEDRKDKVGEEPKHETDSKKTNKVLESESEKAWVLRSNRPRRACTLNAPPSVVGGQNGAVGIESNGESNSHKSKAKSFNTPKDTAKSAPSKHITKTEPKFESPTVKESTTTTTRKESTEVVAECTGKPGAKASGNSIEELVVNCDPFSLFNNDESPTESGFVSRTGVVAGSSSSSVRLGPVPTPIGNPLRVFGNRVCIPINNHNQQANRTAVIGGPSVQVFGGGSGPSGSKTVFSSTKLPATSVATATTTINGQPVVVGSGGHCSVTSDSTTTTTSTTTTNVPSANLAGKSLGKVLMINSVPFLIRNGDKLHIPMLTDNSSANELVKNLSIRSGLTTSTTSVSATATSGVNTVHLTTPPTTLTTVTNTAEQSRPNPGGPLVSAATAIPSVTTIKTEPIDSEEPKPMKRARYSGGGGRKVGYEPTTVRYNSATTATAITAKPLSTGLVRIAPKLGPTVNTNGAAIQSMVVNPANTPQLSLSTTGGTKLSANTGASSCSVNKSSSKPSNQSPTNTSINNITTTNNNKSPLTNVGWTVPKSSLVGNQSAVSKQQCPTNRVLTSATSMKQRLKRFRMRTNLVGTTNPNNGGGGGEPPHNGSSDQTRPQTQPTPLVTTTTNTIITTPTQTFGAITANTANNSTTTLGPKGSISEAEIIALARRRGLGGRLVPPLQQSSLSGGSKSAESSVDRPPKLTTTTTVNNSGASATAASMSTSVPLRSLKSAADITHSKYKQNKAELFNRLKRGKYSQMVDPNNSNILVYRNEVTNTIMGYRCIYDRCTGFVSPRKDKLLQHIGCRHLRCKSHQCPDCAKSFAIASYLTLHRRLVHSTDRPFHCPNAGCAKVFKLKKSLQGHLVRHFYEKPFVCDHPGCTERFIYSYELKDHQNSHSRTATAADAAESNTKTKAL